MKKHFAVYAATLLAMLVLDMLWLLVVARSLYQEGVGHLMAPSPTLWAAAAFYFLFPLGLVIFAVRPAEHASVLKAAGSGALFGLFAYATYDLTNLATLQGWPTSLAFVDMAWGSSVSAASAMAGKLCLDAVNRRAPGV